MKNIFHRHSTLIVIKFITAIDFKGIDVPTKTLFIPKQASVTKSSLTYCSLRLLWIAHAILVDHLQMKDSPLARMLCSAHNLVLYNWNFDKLGPKTFKIFFSCKFVLAQEEQCALIKGVNTTKWRFTLIQPFLPSSLHTSGKNGCWEKSSSFKIN